MQVELPEPQMQNIFDAIQHHFLLAMTKEVKRGEYYPNPAMLGYGSESSPIIQALDMRGSPVGYAAAYVRGYPRRAT